MNTQLDTLKEQVIPQFISSGKILEFEPFGNGHINDTYRLTVEDGGKITRYVLQRLNTNVFTRPKQVMENIFAVTEFLRSKSTAGQDPRSSMYFLRPKSGDPFFKTENGLSYRMYRFIEDTVSLDLPETREDFYQSALAFGNFQRQLSDFPANRLFETIPDFHNTPNRFQNFLRAVSEDRVGRLSTVQPEVAFIREREAFTHLLTDALKNDEIPLRVTHNDTKMNNVLLYKDTRKAVCVIDLDTIMPGLSVTDFGDSIRFGASTAPEDERDLSKVRFDLNLFETYLNGFLDGCDGQLTAQEIELLPEGSKMMTLECGMRFLTDYLEGDTYFRISYPEHNLDRCRTQLKLVAEMEAHWDEMKELCRRRK